LFSGSIVALVTPFENRSLDEEGLRKNIRFQVEKVISITVEEAGGKVPVIAGTGTNSTAKTVENTKRAKALGATAALVVTPYYNKPTQEGLYSHYVEVAREGGLPVVLYNVPGRTGVNLAPDTVIRLSEYEEVVAPARLVTN
jgi:4-hydroxy-tetrahydrodipicolinate synthase